MGMYGTTPAVASLIAVLVAAAGCGGDDGTPVDALDAASTGSTWRLESRPISALYVYRDVAPLAAGRSLRVAFEHELTSCDLWAMPAVTYGAGVATIDARIFTREPPCTLTTRVTRIVTLTLTEGTWTVRGEAPSPATPLTVAVGPAPARACGAAGECELDCDCDVGAGERCVGAGGSGVTRICARPCELDRDCGGDRACVDDDLGAFRACGGGVECDDNFPCATGFTCVAGACTPGFTLSIDTRHECGGDDDCQAPLRCVEATAGLGPHRCEMACRTGGPWCAGAHACDAAGNDAAGLATSDSVCVFLGE